MEKIIADSPEAKSADIVAENIARLKNIFPEAFAEDGIDFEVLKQLLGGAVNENEEKYSFTWAGKRQARQIALTPSLGTLRPATKESISWDTTQNLFIEGDNLEVLKLLQKSYSAKVKMIYIDPPYNSGKDFVYPDNFYDNIHNYLMLTRQIGEFGKLSSNTEASGRFHTDWLNMIYPRLCLARNLLTPDGIMIVAIDDAEVHHLRTILDSIMGMENFEASFIWEGGRKNDSKKVSIGHDYMLVYAKNSSLLKEMNIKWRERKSGLEDVYKKVDELLTTYADDYETASKALQAWFKELPESHESKQHSHYKMIDANGAWYGDNISSPNPRPNLTFEWKGYAPPANGWRYDREAMSRLDEAGLLIYPSTKKQRIQYKRYLHHTETWSPASVFYKDRRASSKALESLMGDSVFNFPKDIDVIARFIKMITEPGDIIMDFFAGSGATAHATMVQNSFDEVDRRFILVQLPEPLDADNKDQKSAANFCDIINKPKTIAELTKERIRRASDLIKSEQTESNVDLGFRVFKLDSSNIRPWNPDINDVAGSLLAYTDNLLPNRTEQDLLYEVLLKFGLDLSSPMQEKNFADHTVYSMGQGVLFACLSKAITQADIEPIGLGIASWRKETNPVGESTVIFRDNAFAGDVAKANMTAILQQHGIDNVRSL